MDNQKQPVFFISDSTAITVETLGRGILSQFPSAEYDVRVFRFVEDEESLLRVCHAITEAQQAGLAPVVFCSLIDPNQRRTLLQTQALVLDVFAPFIPTLEQHWDVHSMALRGRSHGRRATPNYERRMQAVQFALTCDDGVQSLHYDKAELILLGVSRSGKTPTSLYLAMQYSLFVANYPLTEDDLQLAGLPAVLQPHRPRLFGLSISAARLHEIRQERRPNSPYAELAQCEYEVRRMEGLYRQEAIGFVDVTSRSVEEVAGQILLQTGRSQARPA
ncbi:MAG: pyruvate, phosphate dikinase/phosphoenolpyruvate synthase regulator [Gammaproteobacteria bacterium]|nr:pyruvate, phosphate dikinase/phosphoenolpyruvate synthase regulator [Gammaproteobacteria bacterium]